MNPRLERWIWAVVIALVLLVTGCWVYRAHAGSDEVLAMKLKVKDDSLKTAIQVRDSVEEQLAHLEKYAAKLHDSVGLADRRADSLTRVADRHRTFRLRVIDSLHVGVTADSASAEEIHEVPIQITEQLALDSAALGAQDDRAEKKGRELTVRMTEIGALKKTVQLDSVAIRQLEGQVADLTAVKTPRFTFKEGVGVGLTIAAVLKLAAFFIH
jgi:hypothetical protein